MLLDSQLSSTISALTIGVHAGQIFSNATGARRGDAKLFSRGATTLESVAQLSMMFQEIIAASHDRDGWERQRQPRWNESENVAALNRAALRLSPRLPVNVLTRYLLQRVQPNDEVSARAIANLTQLCLEIRHDGTQLQQLFRYYVSRGLKVSFTQLGLPNSDADFLKTGRDLSALCGRCPYETDAAAWQIALRKVDNWGEKNSGRRDKFTLAREMLADSAIKPLLPALQKLPPTRLGILGHSMTMSAHWSSAGSWCEVAAETARLVNPRIEYRSFQEGSFTPSRAVVSKLDALLAYRPTHAIILLLLYTPEDRAALQIILGKLRANGCRVFVVDDVRPWFTEKEYPRIKSAQAFERRACKMFGVRFVNFYDLGKKSPRHKRWVCLDKVHMVEEGHLFYAREWLKLWASIPR
jgi:hypothetical protein